jgi:hypothetical protein
MSADDSIASVSTAASNFSFNARERNLAIKDGEEEKMTKAELKGQLLYLDPDSCRALFSPTGKGYVCVCGNDANCARQGHKTSRERGDVGVAGYYHDVCEVTMTCLVGPVGEAASSSEKIEEKAHFS